MQKEYDLNQLKIKRRGLLVDLPSNDNSSTQVSCVLLLDKDIVDFFQKAAEQPNALPYQAQINQMLRSIINERKCSV